MPELAEFGRSKVVKLGTAAQLDADEVWASYSQAVQLALRQFDAVGSVSPMRQGGVTVVHQRQMPPKCESHEASRTWTGTCLVRMHSRVGGRGLGFHRPNARVSDVLQRQQQGTQ